MTDIQRHATASWQGSARNGRGELSSSSGNFHGILYSFPARFENGEGSNPEEFIGAAHAACFDMVVALELSKHGTPPDNIETCATVTLAKTADGYEITSVHLDTKAKVPDIDEAVFRRATKTAFDNCPVSQLLEPGLEKVKLTAVLE